MIAPPRSVCSARRSATWGARQAQLAGAQPERAGRQAGVRELDALSLTRMLRLITAPAPWPCFEPILGPKTLFEPLMERVREISNQLLHFRGQLSPLDREALVRTDTWLKRRPAWPATTPSAVP